jgi:hypothetical protein
MKTVSARKLYAYWDERRGSRLAPERGEIEPGAIREVLGDTFILSHDVAADHPFRLAGTRVCVLFGNELKGQSFVQIWDAASRGRIRDLAARVAAEAAPVVAGVTARTAEGSQADLELLLLPLYHRGRMKVRLLGVLTPLANPYWLGAETVTALTLGTTRHLGGAIMATAPRLVRGATRPQLTVHEGGRE